MEFGELDRAASERAVQDIARQLSTTLGRRVVVDVAGSRADVSGEPGGAADGGSQRQLRVPVGDARTTIGHIAVDLAGGTPLARSEFETIDAAVLLVRAVVQADEAAPLDRKSVLAHLIVDAASMRRASLSRALREGWIARASGIVVRALLVDAAAGEVETLAFARHLAVLRPVPIYFAGAMNGMVFFISVAQPDVDLSAAILREAHARRIRVLGIGTSVPRSGVDDLAEAADEAGRAASLSAALPQFAGEVGVDALGGWLLLSAATVDPSHLRIISPAAHALYSLPDESQRVTVETYLDVGSNVVAACEILFVHRTTLYYRLERMPEVVRDALADGLQRSTLHLALKLIRLWEATGRL